MSNFPKPDDLEVLLEKYSHMLEDYSKKFNPFFGKTSHELKNKVDHLRNRIEKYAHYSKNEQLKHLALSDRAFSEIKEVHLETLSLESKISELEKMFKLGQNLL